MLTSRVLGAALCSFLLGGCLSGQTGSPDCAPRQSCVCDTLYSGGALLRVHSESATDGALVAVVDEVLGDVYGPRSMLRVGDRVGGSTSAGRPCDAEDTVPQMTGADLFVLFIPGRDGGYPDCDSETPEVCAELRSAALLDGHFQLVVPWEEELSFGADHRLARSEAASVLGDLDACLERFPFDPAPPCNDSTVVCSVSHPSSAPLDGPWVGVVIGLGLIGAARRRCRRSV